MERTRHRRVLHRRERGPVILLAYTGVLGMAVSAALVACVLIGWMDG
jgi:hypothetical protein